MHRMWQQRERGVFVRGAHALASRAQGIPRASIRLAIALRFDPCWFDSAVCTLPTICSYLVTDDRNKPLGSSVQNRIRDA
ncbi:hypothetical protein BC834DRAFT_920821 [Gloeopeniophorella convolvens]|nr:hypothetical protein BC834DRAFT_920821 [Gloeopeniophorella convolvens]